MEHTAWQGSLFAGSAERATSVGHSPRSSGAAGAAREAVAGDLLPMPARRRLAHGAWLDHAPAWLPGADELFAVVRDGVTWRQRMERIHGREVPQPRLTAHLRIEELPGTLALFRELGAVLSRRYGVAFETVGINHYRDGRDSVAWHGDRVARDLPTATIAIVSLGQARPFRFRPADGGRSEHLALGHGDLLVMGGSFQRTWRHAVPKQAAAGPRISVTYRHAYPPRRP